MKLRKIIFTQLSILLSAAILVSCSAHSSMSFTFNVETGDSIKVELDTSNGLQLTQENGNFYVKNGEEEILQGLFATKEDYDFYVSLKDSSVLEVIEEGKGNNNNDYFFYTCEGEFGTEYDFIVWVENSNTGVLIGSLVDKESAKNAFDSLTISVD